MKNDRRIRYGSARASLTIEASLVLSIALLIFVCLMYPFFILGIQLQLQAAMETSCSQQAAYAFVQEYSEDSQLPDTAAGKALAQLTDLGIGIPYTVLTVESEVGRDRLNRSCILNGCFGLSFDESSFMEDDRINLVASYQVKLPFPVKNKVDFVQRSMRRLWVGKEEESGGEAAEEYVFVTETGTVYHLYEDCSHIRLSVEAVSYESLEDRRNTSGGKYYPCERCRPGSGGEVYITSDGDRYHRDRTCSGLKRTVKKIPISQVGSRGLCRRCAQRAGR